MNICVYGIYSFLLQFLFFFPLAMITSGSERKVRSRRGYGQGVLSRWLFLDTLCCCHLHICINGLNAISFVLGVFISGFFPLGVISMWFYLRKEQVDEIHPLVCSFHLPTSAEREEPSEMR